MSLSNESVSQILCESSDILSGDKVSTDDKDYVQSKHIPGVNNNNSDENEWK
jgi:hypothetical protein